MVVSVSTGEPVELSTPELLFDNAGRFVVAIDPYPDGERFAVVGDTSGLTQVNVVLTWLEELQAPARP